jgi:hypothetical protein
LKDRVDSYQDGAVNFVTSREARPDKDLVVHRQHVL